MSDWKDISDNGSVWDRTGQHTFHIPVMGTGFTIDTPLRIARYGISSVMSIGDDVLIEAMRKYHCERSRTPYEPIDRKEPDARARRITAYLNLIDHLVRRQIETCRRESFIPGSDITRYFALLPDSPIRSRWLHMTTLPDGNERSCLEAKLRREVRAGSIDVNIMVKVDGDDYLPGNGHAPEDGVAMSAMRGFAQSSLHSSVVLSAGLNRRLYGYMATFEDFFPHGNQPPKKTIVLKVSDYRSALLQGKMLAKLGLWVSEYRIESGLNCGGHAFATKGELMGPILEEFRSNRLMLTEKLRECYLSALAAAGRNCLHVPSIRITAQGGIGTGEEHRFVLNRYVLDSVGWGTPFLLVPEATSVDLAHLRKLVGAGSDDVYLSQNSPLGVPFWSLKTSQSETVRLDNIEKGIPGSSCPKGFLRFDTEFTSSPICRASRQYQQLKIRQIEASNLSPHVRQTELESVQSKTCLCQNLAAGVLMKNNLSGQGNTSICCGPGIESFSRVATLEEMADHIYGRRPLGDQRKRPHMFITELKLYVEHLSRETKACSEGLTKRTVEFFEEFRENLLKGIAYYRELAKELELVERLNFMQALEALSRELDGLRPLSVAVS